MANVLVACEFSAVVRTAFERAGHYALSCDLLPSEQEGEHVQGDVTEILDWGWDLMIAHPPCTFLCNSGVRWLHEQTGRWQQMAHGAHFFKTLMDAPIPHIAIENPIMHKYAVDIIGRRQNQVIQPWQFGHGETKATCLWLKNLPELQPSQQAEGRVGRVHQLPPSPERWKLRSITYPGIAEAMARQWGDYIREDYLAEAWAA
jgi:hypothetical protein